MSDDSEALPSFRAFLSAELPFRVAPTAITRAAGAATLHDEEQQARQRAEIHNFLPADFLSGCALRNPPMAAAAPAAARHGPPSTMPAEWSSSASSAGSDGSDAAEGAGGDGDAEACDGRRTRAGRDERAQAPPSGSAGFAIADGHAYSASPVFLGWRGTDWGGADTARAVDAPGTETADLDSLSFLQRQRATVFPSQVPQLLVQGFYRNDLLVKVTRRRRVKRRRNAATGELLEECELEEEPADTGDASALPLAPRAEVVGVVSRHVKLARPADFSFPFFTAAQHEQMPHACSVDLFPPMRFLSERATYEARYNMGGEANSSVEDQVERLHSRTAVPAANNGESRVAEDEPVARPTLVSSVTVDPEDVEHMPPARSAVQQEYLASMGSSLDGSLPGDPVEVRVVAGLLAARPVWSMEDLKQATLRSGRCPRRTVNTQVIVCLTYIVTRGCFNRLRIRMGYNPFASALDSVAYQRLTVRVPRRSELGVHVRDLSRSPRIAEATDAVLRKHSAAIALYKQQHSRNGTDYRGTLVESFCKVVQRGNLGMPCQLIDLLDDSVYAGLVAHVDRATNMMPPSRRRSPNGWLSTEACTHALAHYTDALRLFLQEEVLPALRALRDSGAGKSDRDGASESGADDEDDRDGERSSDVTSASASSRNVSDGDEA